MLHIPLTYIEIDRVDCLPIFVCLHSNKTSLISYFVGCEARFTAKSSLYVHMKKHDHSGEKINYHCPIEGCLKKYSSKASLRSHIGKHFSNISK
jgi:uncharacterized Zn-finger protein